MHYLYKISFPNGKIYIGQTNRPNKRWQEHKYAMKSKKPRLVVTKALKKYGYDNCVYEIIASCQTQDNINWTEQEVIKQYNCLVPNGYNVMPGGNNVPKSEEWKKRMSKRVSGKANPMFGQPGYWKGKHISDEMKQALSEAASHRTGEFNGFYGKQHSEDTKKRMSATKLGKPNYKLRGRVSHRKGKCKLSIEERLAIRADARSYRQLATIYGVSKRTIARIKKGLI